MRENLGFLIVWICSGACFWSYENNHSLLTILFTLLSIIYFPLVGERDKKDD